MLRADAQVATTGATLRKPPFGVSACDLRAGLNEHRAHRFNRLVAQEETPPTIPIKTPSFLLTNALTSARVHPGGGLLITASTTSL